MKGLILGTDYIIDKNGHAKILEINTNSRLTLRRDEDPNWDFSGLSSFISSSNFSKVHMIYATYGKRIVDEVESICTDNGILFERHVTNPNAITVPYIEDADDIFIVRISYDTTAIVDEDYAKDKFKLSRAIQDTDYSPKTYISSSDDIFIDGFSSEPEFSYSGSSPNFIVKKRYPSYDRSEYPKLYKVHNLTELNTLKSNLPSDELLQEFIDCDLTDGKRSIIRTVDLVYGSNLTPINLGSYQINHIVTEDIWENTYNDDNTLQLKDRGKYVTYYSEGIGGRSYIYDEDQKVLMSDNSYKTFAEVEENDSVKTLVIPSLPLDDESYRIADWSGSYTEVLTSSSLSDTTVVAKISSPPVYEYFLRVTLDDGVSFDDLPSTTVLVKEDEQVRFAPGNALTSGSEIVMYDTTLSGSVIKTVSSIEIVFKTEEILGTADVEPSDLFLPFVSNDYTLIQHNPCVQPQCAMNSCQPGFKITQTQCNTCFISQCYK